MSRYVLTDVDTGEIIIPRREVTRRRVRSPKHREDDVAIHLYFVASLACLAAWIAITN